MDSYREHPSEFEPGDARRRRPSGVLPDIGSDERRMHVRAYNYWASLLDGRDYPSIEDLEPGDLKDFAPHSVLLDFTAGRDNPATPYIGDAIREECGLGDDIQTIADVPSRSLLSRLTDHYMQIIANRAPVGFEAEFDNQRGETICYRGILMPFSSDGDTIDFIYGVINWKKGDAQAALRRPRRLPAVGEDDEVDSCRSEPIDEDWAERRALPIHGIGEARHRARAAARRWSSRRPTDEQDDETLPIELARMPGSATACGPRAKPPKPPRRPTAAAAPRSTRR